MERSVPGVHFLDTFEEERNRLSENGIPMDTSSAPPINTTLMAPPINTTMMAPAINTTMMAPPINTTMIAATSLQSSVVQSAPVPTPAIATPRPEVTEPLQVLRQPLASIIPDMTANRRPKTEDFNSTESPMAAAASPAGQSLIDFLDKLDNYKPTLPESIVQYHMQCAGLSNSDPRVTQLIALAAQKYISDVVNDAYHYSQTQKTKKSSEKKPTLTLDVLKPVLAEYAINVKKPAYLQ